MRVLGIASVLVWLAMPAAALSRNDGQSEITDPLNHAYAVYLGGGLYVTGDTTVFIVRGAPKIRVWDENAHPFGVSLRFIGMVGFYDYELDDLEDVLELPSTIGTWAAAIGVEFPIRILDNDNWTLVPFLDVGLASDSEFRDRTVVTGIGARSRAQFRDKRHLHVLRNELIKAGNYYEENDTSEGYTVFRIDYEMRGIVDYELFKREFDLGFLFLSETFLDSPVIGLVDPQEVNQRFELGFTTGATERWKALKNKVTTPRFGVSYRFGQGTSGVRFVIRFQN